MVVVLVVLVVVVVLVGRLRGILQRFGSKTLVFGTLHG